MSIDVLLTYPTDGLRLFQSMIPLGLLSIGTVLKNAGYTVKIIDFNHYTRDFRRDLRAWQPKIIGIGGTTPSRSGSFLTAQIAKKALPGVSIVYGGVHASFTTQETLQHIPQIDYIIQGEGERSFAALCDYVTGRCDVPIDHIPGLARRVGAEIVAAKPQRINDLSLLPIPDRTMLPFDYKLTMEFLGGPGDFIITSRGCPAACNFCAASRMFPGGIRLRNTESVGAEIETLLSRRPLAGLKLFDSTFTADREHVLAFCKLIRQFRLAWECEIRADTVDADLLRVMRESGCYYINMGMETINKAHLARIAKGISPAQVLHVLEICKQIGIRSKVFFTFGHPQQTFKECREDIRFIEEHRNAIDFFAVTVGMRIYPGTRLASGSKEAGILRRTFAWTRSAASWRNLLVFEPGDVPILFQKQLGPFRLLVLLLTLLSKRLICTEHFLMAMVLENMRGIIRRLVLQARFTGHRVRRVSEVLLAAGKQTP
jgi:anaerobic magnesium-protoporphyrin IX monomethyl ester cyclase